MENLLLFMGALKDNGNFVWLVFFVFAFLIALYVVTLVNRGIKREHERVMEEKRIESARGIVPLKPRDGSDY